VSAATERDERVLLLEQLGEGPRLRVRLLICRAGGAAALDRLGRIPFRVKDAVKAVRSRVRRARR
jgi:hypothetical protein